MRRTVCLPLACCCVIIYAIISSANACMRFIHSWYSSPPASRLSLSLSLSCLSLSLSPRASRSRAIMTDVIARLPPTHPCMRHGHRHKYWRRADRASRGAYACTHNARQICVDTGLCHPPGALPWVPVPPPPPGSWFLGVRGREGVCKECVESV
jgi:hypothetical protein